MRRMPDRRHVASPSNFGGENCQAVSSCLSIRDQRHREATCRDPHKENPRSLPSAQPGAEGFVLRYYRVAPDTAEQMPAKQHSSVRNTPTPAAQRVRTSHEWLARQESVLLQMRVVRSKRPCEAKPMLLYAEPRWPFPTRRHRGQTEPNHPQEFLDDN